MQFFIQQVLQGVVDGSIYALIGLALVMIYQSTHHINLAQGEMATFSAYIGATALGWGWPYWAAGAFSLIASFILAAVIERVIVRRFYGAIPLVEVIVLVALFIGINSLTGVIFGPTVRSMPSPFVGGWLPDSRYLGPHDLGTLVVVGILLSFLFVFFTFTSLGLAMRAAAFNPTSSRLMGVPVERMLMLGWGLAATIGGVAGLLAAPKMYLEPNMMSGVLIYGFAAALLGGISSSFGTVIAGFIIGIVINLLGTYVIGTNLRLTAAMVMIILVLLLRPDGLFGRGIATRV
jgi:branched-chain amino acid transport system permease protein